ncbi:MAG: CapA family protein [Sandaracinaceae bacterium]
MRAAVVVTLFAALPVAVLSLALPVEAQRTGRVTLGASGDLLFHTRVVEVGNRRGYDHLFQGLGRVITEEEIAFANLETPLSVDREPTRGDPPRLGAPPEAAGGLAGAGLDVLSVANNHAWDQRHTGMVHTLATLRARGIEPVGAAPEEADAPGPVIVERNGLRVAFVAFTVILQGHPGTRRPDVRIATWDERRARLVLASARENADIVVASMHWGLGYRHEDRSEQRSRAQRLIRYGADVVLGHGPHVLQRVERVESERGQALIAYSLGNLISNQGYRYRRGHRDRDIQLPLREPATRDAVWLRTDIDVQNGRIRIADVSAVPLWTANNWWDEERHRADSPDIRVIPLREVTDEALREERREAISEVLGDDVRLLP